MTMIQDVEAAVELLGEEISRLAGVASADRSGSTPPALFTCLQRVRSVRCALQTTESALENLMFDLAEPRVAPAGSSPAYFPATASVKTGVACHIDERGRLHVSIDGNRLFGKDDSDLFVRTLAHFGFERVQRCNLVCCKHPLVSRVSPARRANGYPSVREYDGWHVVTHSSTRAKLHLLQRLLKAMGS